MSFLTYCLKLYEVNYDTAHIAYKCNVVLDTIGDTCSKWLTDWQTHTHLIIQPLSHSTTNIRQMVFASMKYTTNWQLIISISTLFLGWIKSFSFSFERDSFFQLLIN